MSLTPCRHPPILSVNEAAHDRHTSSFFRNKNESKKRRRTYVKERDAEISVRLFMLAADDKIFTSSSQCLCLSLSHTHTRTHVRARTHIYTNTHIGYTHKHAY